MPKKLSPVFIGLIQDAAYKSFWYKRSLREFLRRSGVPPGMLAQLNPDGSKLEWLDLLFPQLEASVQGQQLILDLGRSLAEQRTFPDLQRCEDSQDKIAAAHKAVAALRDAIGRLNEDAASSREAETVRQRAREEQQRAVQTRASLSSLQDRLNEMAGRIGTQAAGYEFQAWFYDLAAFSEIDHRRPYVAPDKRQIDGSITIDGTTYLVELKFTMSQAGVTDIDSIKAKVDAKADNTMAIIISMSGFEGGAKRAASYARSPLLLLDSTHLYLALSGAMNLPEIVRRVRRHSSQEGIAYLAINDFGG